MQAARTAVSPGGSKPYFHGPFQCLSTLYKHGGLQTCYKGLSIMAMRDVPASATYFLIYESFSDWMADHKYGEKYSMLSSLLGGGLAGVLSWFLIMPFDVIKNQLQADFEGKRFNSIRQCLVDTYNKGGVRMFYTGALVTAMRAFPVNAITFLVYVQSMKFLSSQSTATSQVSGL